MTIKKALLLGFILALTLILATVYLGHLWVFIILVVIAFVVIALNSLKKSSNNSHNNKD